MAKSRRQSYSLKVNHYAIQVFIREGHLEPYSVVGSLSQLSAYWVLNQEPSDSITICFFIERTIVVPFTLFSKFHIDILFLFMVQHNFLHTYLSEKMFFNFVLSIITFNNVLFMKGH